MQLTSTTKQNPLGLNIDFLFGRGFLWARQARLSDWIVLENLRMEIPDLQFPFDARGGVSRFRNTRCLVREIEISISEAGLQDLIERAASQIEGFEELNIRLNEGVAHVSLKLSAFGANSHVSFRVALIPPEPARNDEVHLSIYDYRAFGPLAYPARVLATELLTSLLNTPALRPPGRGDAFTVGVAGDILSLHPIKLLLLYLFPSHGWKLPNLAGVVLDGARIRPGQLSLRASSRGERWHDPSSATFKSYQIMGTLEGARAVAAYEAKDLFSSVDTVLFEGGLERALEQLAALRDRYGPHPELIARTLDCLLSEPSPANLAEATAICKDLIEEDPEDLQALLALPSIARHEQRSTQEILERYELLAHCLRQRHELDDWVLCQITMAQLILEREPEQAATYLREILKVSPRHMDALELLAHLYERVGEWNGYEEALKRLTGVYTDRASLLKTYLSLANHLLDRRGEPAEARLYLEKVLRLDPTNLEALDTLGQGYLVDDEPLRALKAFSSAARAAQAHQQLARAAALHHRVAKLWRLQLHNSSEALLSVRRALQLQEKVPHSPDASPDRLPVLVYLEEAAQLAEERERWDEALEYRTALLEHLERAYQSPLDLTQEDEGGVRKLQLKERLIQSHRALATIYVRRQREDAASPHWMRVLELNPQDEQAAARQEEYLRSMGQPEQLIAFYKDLMEKADRLSRKVELHIRLANLYDSLQMTRAAGDQLSEALRLDPANHIARRRVVEILKDEGRHESLGALLSNLLIKLQDREARYEVLVALGEVQFTHLGKERAAVRSFFEALDLRPTDLRALQGAQRALERLIELDGHESAAPVGSETCAALLERVLHRQLDLMPDALDRAYALDRIAVLAESRGAIGQAVEARKQAKNLRDDAGRRGQLGGFAVDTRLDDLLGPGPGSEAIEEQTHQGPFSALEEATLAQESSVVKDLVEKSEGPSSDLENFRAKMLDILKSPSSLQELAAGDSRDSGALKKLLSQSLKKSSLVPDKPVPRINRKKSEAELTAALEDARGSDDYEGVVKYGEQLLQRHFDSVDDLDLERSRVASLSAEVGEVLYYDLEESEKARVHLERAQRLDPEGAGKKASVLNALESIYEEAGDVSARIKLLKKRLDAADSEDLATTYRLLLAQVYWDEQEDEDAARAELEYILERDPRHEAAHRLLASIALDLEEWQRAARHYELVLSERSGGLDEVELERELADLYLHRLDQPDRALRHYEGVITAAPADAQALEGIKQCQTVRDDWQGYLKSLERELGLLLGTPSEEMFAESSGLCVSVDKVPAALRSAASQIVADAAQVVEEKLERDEYAHRLWHDAYALWVENVDALERCIELDRKLDKYQDLASDLELLSDMLLDITDRFNNLYDAALIYRNHLQESERARQVLAEAIAMVEGVSDEPERLASARRDLLSWTQS